MFIIINKLSFIAWFAFVFDIRIFGVWVFGFPTWLANKNAKGGSEQKATKLYSTTAKPCRCLQEQQGMGPPIMCAMVKSRVFWGMGNLPALIGNPYSGYINTYYWVDDHPLLYGKNGTLDPGTCQK